MIILLPIVIKKNVSIDCFCFLYDFSSHSIKVKGVDKPSKSAPNGIELNI